MAIRVYPYDPAEHLDGPEAYAIFMADALETGDVHYIAGALGVVARAKGMADIAKETGLSREQLYRSLSGRGNPTLKTVTAVLKKMGVKMTAKAS